MISTIYFIQNKMQNKINKFMMFFLYNAYDKCTHIKITKNMLSNETYFQQIFQIKIIYCKKYKFDIGYIKFKQVPRF